jgi:membrane fusion protein, multidrug efflux system
MHKNLIIAVFCLSLFSCSEKKEDTTKKNQPPPPTSVDVIIAGTKEVTNNIEANGAAVASEMLDIHPEISGRLTFLNVPDGANISAGTVLAKINDAELQAQLNKSKVQLDLAAKTEERLRKLLVIGGINQADYDLALNNVNNIKADIELLKAQIDKTIVKAPFAGVLGLRQTSPGAYVTPQSILATLQVVNKINIDFTLPEQFASLIKKGNTVTVLTNELGVKRTATIIATQAEINASTRNLKVRAVLNGNPINPGSFVKVLLASSNKNSNIVIPTNAIIPEADGKKVVIVKDGKGKFVTIETGLRTASGIEVVKGLTIGDSVVVTGVLFVRPNAAVKIKNIKKLEE